PPERLLDPTFLATQAPKISALINARLRFLINRQALAAASWSVPEPLVERQSITLDTHLDTATTPGVLEVNADLFPYDPAHQTFVNFYEHGIVALARRVAVTGVDHIVRGPDHVIFLIGLLLLGGTIRQLAMIVSAFTVA